MLSPEQLEQWTTWFTQAQTILIFFLPNAPLDHMAAALGLALTLQAQGKDVRWLSPSAPGATVDLAGLTDTSTELGFKNLTISFPYRLEAVDKVSYHIDDDQTHFHLVVQPQRGHKPLDAQEVQYSYTGAEADLIITVGVGQLVQLEQLYEPYKQLFEDTNLISVHSGEVAFGGLKIETSQVSGISEYVTRLLSQLQLGPTAAAATNLLAGIEETTQSFRSLMTTAETLEAAAQLMRSGARRIARQTGDSSRSNSTVTAKPAKNGVVATRANATINSADLASALKQNQKSKNFQLPGGRRGESGLG
jgi:hypothetical protein